MPRHLVPRLVAALVALVGVLLLISGVLMARSGGSEQRVVARLSTASVPVVVTAPGMLTLDGSRVQVQVGAANASTPVFLGIGRATDVSAYLGEVARQEVTGMDGDRLLSARRGSQQSLPDPAGVDIWAVSVRGKGAAALVWPGEPGSWRLVVATDGAAAAPRSLALSWTHPPGGSAAPALIAVGLLLLVGGLVTLLVQWSRRGLQRDDEPAGYPYDDEGVPGRRREPAADEATTVLRRVPAVDEATTLLRRVPATGPPGSSDGSEAESEAGMDQATTLLRRVPDADPLLRRPRSRGSKGGFWSRSGRPPEDPPEQAGGGG